MISSSTLLLFIIPKPKISPTFITHPMNTFSFLILTNWGLFFFFNQLGNLFFLIHLALFFFSFPHSFHVSFLLVLKGILLIDSRASLFFFFKFISLLVFFFNPFGSLLSLFSHTPFPRSKNQAYKPQQPSYVLAQMRSYC